MNTFITRVELHGANEQDYANLHTAMQAQKFNRILVNGNTKYQLPTAEYVSYSSTMSAEGIRDLAKKTANTTGRSSWILTIQSAGMAWELLVVH